MARQIRFYLGRLVKRGELTSQMIVEAIRQPSIIDFRGIRYSFTDFQTVMFRGRHGFYARLVKYKQEGAVGVVQEDEHVSAEASVPNLIDVSSQFVYVPEFSGIAYRHIWNALPKEQFERVFSGLVTSKYLLTACDIEPIADLRTFVMRLAKLDAINELAATVSPPNPLFGPCWKSLSDYLRRRNLNEARFREWSEEGIETNISEIAGALSGALVGPDRAKELMEPLLDGVGDAALLMAADGYGHARVVGKEDGRVVVVRTSDNQKSLAAANDSPPEALFEKVYLELEKLNDDHGLQHP